MLEETEVPKVVCRLETLVQPVEPVVLEEPVEPVETQMARHLYPLCLVATSRSQVQVV